MSEQSFEHRFPTEPYAAFYNQDARSQANVYIVSLGQVAQAEKMKKDADVIVVDDRTSSDPNMQVRHSYKIMTRETKAAICQILLDYNKKYPVTPPWHRSFHSLMAEWALHNIAYLMKVQPERTGHVDFNNDDEGKGMLDYLKQM